MDWRTVYGRREAVFAEMQAILDRAEREKRDVTEEELRRYRELEAELDRLLRQDASAAVPADPFAGEKRFLGPEDKLALVPPPVTLGEWLHRRYTGTDAELRAVGISSGGGALLPHPIAAFVIDLARSEAVAVRAGVTTVRLQTSDLAIPKVVSGPTAAWRNEHQLIPDSDVTFASITLEPKSLATLVRVSRELLMDSALAERAVTSEITKAMALALDAAILAGSGTDPEPRGILNTSGVATVSHTGALTYQPLIQAAGAVIDANHTPRAAIMHPSRLRELLSQTDSTGQPLQRPPYLDGITFFQTTAMPTGKVIVGDLRVVYLGIAEDISIEILRERYADYGQIGILAHARADVAVGDPSAIAVITIT